MTKIKLTLKDDGYAREIEGGLLQNGFTVKRLNPENIFTEHVQIIFWDGPMEIEQSETMKK